MPKLHFLKDTINLFLGDEIMTNPIQSFKTLKQTKEQKITPTAPKKHTTTTTLHNKYFLEGPNPHE